MNSYTAQILKCWRETRHHIGDLRINPEAIQKAATRLAAKNLKPPSWQINGVTPKDHGAFVSQSFYLAAIDFGFTHSDGTTRYQFSKDGPIGSLAAAQCFYHYFGEQPVTPREILRITESTEKTDKFFRGVTTVPMVEERRRNLEEAAKRLRYWFDGEPNNILENAGWRLRKSDDGGILEILRAVFPHCFNSDFTFYRPASCRTRTRILPFLKRTLLWPLVYQGRALNSNGVLTPLKDPENLGPIADCAVPNALRNLGIMEYDNVLRALVDSRHELAEYHPATVAIRMASVYAADSLLKSINALLGASQKPLITMVELDYWLWMLGRKVKTPYHFTRTTAY